MHQKRGILNKKKVILIVFVVVIVFSFQFRTNQGVFSSPELDVGSPDLIVNEMSVNLGEQTEEGREVIVKSTIGNIGDAQADSTITLFYIREVNLSLEIPTPSVGPNMAEDVGGIFYVNDSGTFEMISVADINKDVDELVEDNNGFKVEFSL